MDNVTLPSGSQGLTFVLILFNQSMTTRLGPTDCLSLATTSTRPWTMRLYPVASESDLGSDLAFRLRVQPEHGRCDLNQWLAER